MRADRLLLLLSLPILLALTGCGANLDQPTSNQAVSGFSGSTFGGQQPVTGATVSLWAVGTSNYGAGATKIATATAVTTAAGNYSFGSFTCPYSNTPTYLLSSGGLASGSFNNAHIVLAAASGACGNLANATVNINEVTTAATAYAMSHFFTTTLGGGYTTDAFGGTAAGSGTYNLGLVNADLYTVPTLVNLAAGSSAAARTTVTSGTVTRTFESAKLYSIANILAACVNSNGSATANSPCGKLFADTNDGNGTPVDTLQAAVQMALFPYKNVSALYTLPPAASPFVGLATQPNDWSLAVSYTSTAFQLGIFSTPTFRSTSNIDIDAAGNVWFPTNSAASHGLAYLDPLSSTPTFAGPYLTSLLNPQYLAITNQGRIYADSTNQGDVGYTLTASPASSIDATPARSFGYGGPIFASPNDSYDSSLDYITFTIGGGSDALGNYFMFVAPDWPQSDDENESSSIAAVAPVAFAPNANGDLITAGGGNNGTCDMEKYGNVRVSTGTAPCYAGGIAQTTYNSNYQNQDFIQTISSTNGLCDYAPGDSNSGECFTSPVTLNDPQGVAIDGLGNVWIANYGNASISTLGYTYSSGTHTDFHATSTVPYLHGTNNGGTMINPIGIAIDNSGNVWTSNGCITATGCTPGSFTLSELVGAAAPTVTPLANGIDNNTTGTRPQAITAPGAQSRPANQPPTARRGVR